MNNQALEHWTPVIGSSFWAMGLGLSLLFVIFIFFIGSKISSKNREYLLYAMGAYQLIEVSFFQLYRLFAGEYVIATHLPLQLCSISGILAGLVVFYRKQLIFEFLFFFGLAGFIHSILTPEFTGGIPSAVEIFDYYVGHSMLFVVPIWLMRFNGMRLTIHSWWRSFLYLQLIIVIVSQLNAIIGNGANYMYLAKAPLADSVFVVGGASYILVLNLAALLHFIVFYYAALKVFK